MTISVRFTVESKPADKVLGVYIVDKKSKKQTLYTKLQSTGQACVLSVYDSQDVVVKELEA